MSSYDNYEMNYSMQIIRLGYLFEVHRDGVAYISECSNSSGSKNMSC
jgi:hypothetical protein